ncbi:MAG: phosphate uptake regulator PhoU, partial [Nitrososphaerales archaeon]|nr:phosphate uptake regulator PhoU [Nitrososphaerales archaeon]
STLTVSIPRDWVKEVGLKQGDIISIKRESDGTLRLIPGIIKEPVEVAKCVVDADKCTRVRELTRILVGLYIIGYDTIQIVSKRDLSSEHLEEVRNVTQRLTGLSVVEQTLNQILIQNFLDPTRFPVEGLLRRIFIITSSMQKAAIRALRERKVELAKEVIHMENEIDKIYWLVVRQLLLAARNKEIGKKIGIEEPLLILGNRVIAKVLEKIGDYSEDLAKNVLEVLKGPAIDKDILDMIYEFATYVQSVYDRAMNSLLASDIRLANQAIDMVEEVVIREGELVNRILVKYQLTPISKRSKPIMDEKDLIDQVNVAMNLRAIVWSLGQIARYCSTMAEIAINNALERSTDFCRIEGRK